MPELGERRIYVEDVAAGRVTGPFYVKFDDQRIRDALKTDLSYNVEDAWGQHNLKLGIEVADETYRDEPIVNPILVDETEPFQGDFTRDHPPLPGQVTGSQTLFVYVPLRTPQRAASFSTSLYATDSWKPWSNLTLGLGLRLDREDVDSSGFTSFDPRRERRRAIALWSDVCDAARRQGDVPLGTSNCREGFYDSLPPTALGMQVRTTSLPPDLAHLARLDTDGNGLIDADTADRHALLEMFTTTTGRGSRNFSIHNTNLAPRFSFAWDPWADGRTRVFGTSGRCFDRLFLFTVASEIGPEELSFAFFPDPVRHQILPGTPSRATSSLSINQVDRDLRTPRTDEFSLGIERELAPEWSIGLTHVRRRARDLLQDIDLNHHTCPQAGAASSGSTPTSSAGTPGSSRPTASGGPASRIRIAATRREGRSPSTPA